MIYALIAIEQGGRDCYGPPMTDLDNEPEILPLGVDGVLVRFARTLTETANTRALQFRQSVQDAQIRGVTEVASSLVSVRMAFDPAVTDRKSVTNAIAGLVDRSPVTALSPNRVWHIPTAFGHAHAPQLAEAARLAGVSPEKAVTDITAAPVRVMAIGFAPGQPYLGLLPERWDIPRQSNLTESLPRGALICAVRQLIIWAADAPTGWRHIGQTAFRVYIPDAPEPFAFLPGDAVQFHAVSDSAFTSIKADTSINGGARCEVLR